MRKHEYFEELCALSAAGQCSPEEETELREHLLDCAACRESQEHFAAILREWPATRQAAVHGRFLRRTDLDEFRQRFAEQAPREGVRLSEEAQDALTRRRWALPLARLRVGWAGASWIAASLVLGIALGAFGYATLRKPNPAL